LHEEFHQNQSDSGCRCNGRSLLPGLRRRVQTENCPPTAGGDSHDAHHVICRFRTFARRQPAAIEKITCYKGLRSIVAEMQPLGHALIDYPNTTELIAKAQKANVSVEIAEAANSFNTMHWSFWLLLALCLGAAFKILSADGKFGKLAGLDPFSPIEQGVDANPSEKRTFDDVAGCEEAIAKLRRVARWLKSPKCYEDFGAKLPRGILAVGPPGTGKTLLARALAGEVDANFFAVHGSSFVEMFVGVGARRIRKLFASAVAARDKTGKPSIIFIDEIDAIGKKRSHGGGSGADSERDQTLNQLLVCMQGFETSHGIVVLAATNMPEALDEALTRPGRFDYQVSVDLPDTHGREKIFSIHSKSMRLAPNVNLRDLAIRTPQFSGADIEQACNEAAIAAAERLEKLCESNGRTATEADRMLTLEDFDHGIDYVQFGDPMLSRARSMSQDDRRNTAIHEAGHCAVQQALQTKGADPITKVTIEPRTKSLGSMQSHAVGDRYGYTQEQLLARITTAMGGRAAQEHLLKVKDTGASNDFEQATHLARLMVTEFGMSRLGPLNVRMTTDDGRSIPKLSDELTTEIDHEWRRILDECYKRAMEIIVANELRVERVAEALLVDQTILGERFLEIWSADFPKPRATTLSAKSLDLSEQTLEPSETVRG
jgi:ATP-dependent metalloprotease FtsH